MDHQQVPPKGRDSIKRPIKLTQPAAFWPLLIFSGRHSIGRLVSNQLLTDVPPSARRSSTACPVDQQFRGRANLMKRPGMRPCQSIHRT